MALLNLRDRDAVGVLRRFAKILKFDTIFPVKTSNLQTSVQVYTLNGPSIPFSKVNDRCK